MRSCWRPLPRRGLAIESSISAAETGRSVSCSLTGIHVSDGDSSVRGLIGAREPEPFDGRWRVFWTAQHGDNVTFEIIRG